MTRSLSLGSALKAAGKAARKASKPRPSKAATKAAAKLAKAAVKAADKAAPIAAKVDANGMAYAVPKTGAQADYRSTLVKAMIKATGKKPSSLKAFSVAPDKLQAACAALGITIAQAVKGGSVATIGGKVSFTDRGLLKYANAFDKAK